MQPFFVPFGLRYGCSQAAACPTGNKAIRAGSQSLRTFLFAPSVCPHAKTHIVPLQLVVEAIAPEFEFSHVLRALVCAYGTRGAASDVQVAVNLATNCMSGMTCEDHTQASSCKVSLVANAETGWCAHHRFKAVRGRTVLRPIPFRKASFATESGMCAHLTNTAEASDVQACTSELYNSAVVDEMCNTPWMIFRAGLPVMDGFQGRFAPRCVAAELCMVRLNRRRGGWLVLRGGDDSRQQHMQMAVGDTRKNNAMPWFVQALRVDGVNVGQAYESAAATSYTVTWNAQSFVNPAAANVRDCSWLGAGLRVGGYARFKPQNYRHASCRTLLSSLDVAKSLVLVEGAARETGMMIQIAACPTTTGTGPEARVCDGIHWAIAKTVAWERPQAPVAVLHSSVFSRGVCARTADPCSYGAMLAARVELRPHLQLCTESRTTLHCFHMEGGANLAFGGVSGNERHTHFAPYLHRVCGGASLVESEPPSLKPGAQSAAAQYNDFARAITTCMRSGTQLKPWHV